MNIENIQLETHTTIKNKIFTIRNTQVMIDKDLAELYDTTTKAFNQAVGRNSDRFPEDFRFQLTNNEKNELVTNCDRLKNLKHSPTNELKLDIEKYNKQNNNLKVYSYKKSHDRFLILDNKIIYHLGASLKDLGNKWFAISKLEDDNLELIQKVKDIRDSK
jgi:hypothetical protein